MVQQTVSDELGSATSHRLASFASNSRLSSIVSSSRSPLYSFLAHLGADTVDEWRKETRLLKSVGCWCVRRVLHGS